MSSSRIHTARSLPYGGLPDRDPPGQGHPWKETLQTETPWIENSLDIDPPCEQNHRQV